MNEAYREIRGKRFFLPSFPSRPRLRRMERGTPDARRNSPPSGDPLRCRDGTFPACEVPD